MGSFKYETLYANSYPEIVEKLSDKEDNDWIQYGDIEPYFFGRRYKVEVKKWYENG